MPSTPPSDTSTRPEAADSDLQRKDPYLPDADPDAAARSVAEARPAKPSPDSAATKPREAANGPAPGAGQAAPAGSQPPDNAAEPPARSIPAPAAKSESEPSQALKPAARAEAPAPAGPDPTPLAERNARPNGFEHGQPQRTAVLLTNLGTPDEPSKAAVRRYLAEFLNDRRVVEIARIAWLPVLHGVVLRTRPAVSAEKYKSIWTDAGSPLKVWTEKQAAGLEAALKQRDHHVTVASAMRYGNPSIGSVLDRLMAEGATRVLVLPAYPQYSAATIASTFDAVSAWSGQQRRLPEFRFVNGYSDDPGYIGALVETIRRHWSAHGQPQRLLMSFHGMPERTLHLGDPYHCECRKTARLVAEALGLSDAQYQVTFQSRFGKAKWLEPATEPTLIALAQAGVERVDVICPGFASDCLETLEEIAIEGRKAFTGAGGKKFHYIQCLNDDADWIAALGYLAERHLAGWPTLEPVDVEALAASRQRAMAAGATR